MAPAEQCHSNTAEPEIGSDRAPPATPTLPRRAEITAHRPGIPASKGFQQRHPTITHKADAASHPHGNERSAGYQPRFPLIFIKVSKPFCELWLTCSSPKKERSADFVAPPHPPRARSGHLSFGFFEQAATSDQITRLFGIPVVWCTARATDSLDETLPRLFESRNSRHVCYRYAYASRQTSDAARRNCIERSKRGGSRCPAVSVFAFHSRRTSCLPRHWMVVITI